MAENEDIQPLVCDNGTGMVKVMEFYLQLRIKFSEFFYFILKFVNTILMNRCVK